MYNSCAQSGHVDTHVLTSELVHAGLRLFVFTSFLNYGQLFVLGLVISLDFSIFSINRLSVCAVNRLTRLDSKVIMIYSLNNSYYNEN